jgi:DNA-binding NarL/FixJ family response regulator
VIAWIEAIRADGAEYGSVSDEQSNGGIPWVKTRVLVVDDQQMLRDELRAILEPHEHFEIVGEGADGEAAVRLVRALRPEVVLMDVVMPGMNGIEATHQIVSENSQTKVIALSVYSDARYVMNMLEAGASGYVLKIAAHDHLLEALKEVLAGRSYLSPEVAGTVLDRKRG